MQNPDEESKLCEPSAEAPVPEPSEPFSPPHDVPPTSLTDESLWAGEVRICSLLNPPDAAIFCLSADYRILELNPAAERLCGCSRNSVIGSDYFHTFLPQDVVDGVAADMRKVLAGKPTRGYPNPVKCADGSVRLYSWNVDRVCDNTGQPIGVIAAGHDITAEKRADDLVNIQRDLAVRLGAVGRLEEGLRICLETAMSTAGMDCGGVYIADRIFGALDLAFHKGLAPEFAARVRHYDAGSPQARLVMTATPFYASRDQWHLNRNSFTPNLPEGAKSIAVLPITHKRRVLGCINLASYTIERLPDHSITAIETMAAQVGSTIARLQAEDALRESEERFRSAFENTLVGLYRTTPEGRILMANPAMAKMMGYSSIHEFLKLDVEKDGYAERGGRAVFKKRIERDGKIVGFESAWRKRDGSVLFVSQSAKAVRDEKGKTLYYEGTVEDITERKQIENALRKSEERFRGIFQNTLVGLYRTTPDGRVLLANPALVNMLGYTSFDELAGIDVEKTGFAMKNGRDVFKTKIEADGKVIGLESAWKKRDGTAVFVSESARAVRDENGNTLYYEGTVEDVTSRKRAEEALRARERFLEAIFEGIQDGLCVLDSDFNVIRANSRMEKMYAHQMPLVGKKCYRIFCSENRPCDACPALKTSASDRAYRETLPYPGAGQTCGWVEVSAFPLADAAGEPAGIIKHVKDVTEQKRAEETLRLLQFSIDRSSDAALWTDVDARFVYVNEAACRSLGYSRDEMLAMTVYDIDPDCTKTIWRDRWEKVKECASLTIESRHLSKDGRIFPVEVMTNHVEFEGKEYHCTFVRDISDRRSAEKRMLRDQAQLKSLASQLSLAEERERRRLATELHDRISQALVIAKIKLDQMSRSVVDESEKNSLDEIRSDLARTIEDTRTLTFDLSSPILYELGFEEAVAEWLSGQIQNKHGIATRFADDGREKPLDDDIRVLLFRSVRELLINVVKHASATEVTVSVMRQGHNIRIVVQDNGVGFDPARVASVAAEKSAFGLFSVRQRLEQLGGRFVIDSAPRRGCTVTMTAPLKENTSLQKEKDEHQSPAGG